jgi:hypothetical protein
MKIKNTKCLITKSYNMVSGSVPAASHALMFEVFTTLLLTTQVYWDEKLCCWESGF